MNRAITTMKTIYKTKALALISAVALLAVSVFSFGFEVRGINYSISNDTEVFVSGSIVKGKIVIPETVTYEGKTYSVVGIGENAFNDRNEIYSVTLPGSVKKIAYGAFHSIDAMQELHFSEGLESIGNNAFTYMGRGDGNFFGGFALPNSVTTIGEEAFRESNFNSSALDLPESLEVIGGVAFRQIIGGVQTVILHENLKSIGNAAFYGVTSIRQVYCLASTPPIIDDNTFADVTANATLYVNSDALGAYQEAAWWKNFSEIKPIQGNVPCPKPDFHFFDNNWLLNITCATPHATIYYTTDGSTPTTNSKKYTEPFFYLGNYTVKAIAVCDGYSNSEVSSFEKDDLSNQCPQPVVSMSEDFIVNIQSAVPGSKIYYSYDASVGYGWGLEYNMGKSKLFDGEFTLTQATHIYAFVVCDGWETSSTTDANFYDNYYVNTPAIYAEGSDNNFYRTISIVSNHEGATVYYTIDGSDPNTSETRQVYEEPFTIDHNLTIKAISTKEGRINSPIAENFISGIDSKFKKGGIYYQRIDNNVNDEVEVTFGDAGYSGEITIPEVVTNANKSYRVTRIGYNAFNGQNNITAFNLPNTIESIGDNAFSYYNGSLKEINIPESVKTIGASAFSECYGLENVIINEGLESIGNDAFYNNQSLKEIVLPSSLQEIGNFAFRYCSALTRCVLGDEVKTIGRYAFANCTNLRSINLPGSLTSLGEYCFGNCNNLQAIKIPQSLKVIPDNAFEYCYALISAEIPATVEEIGRCAFWHCENLTSAVVPEGVNTISYGCFSECYKLSSITLPSTITTIEEYGFYNCRSLKSIILPASLTQIDRDSFNGCEGLTSVYLLATTPPTFSNGNTLLGVAQSGATLYVPSEAVDTYKNTPLWQEFDPNIAAMGNLPAAQPAFFFENYTLTMSTQTVGAAIYYTDDNSEPTTSSKRYTTPIDFLRNDTIRAIAVKDGLDSSPISEFAKSNLKTERPEVSIEEIGEGIFEVTIEAEKPDERLEDHEIYYTTNLRWGWASWPAEAGDEMLRDATPQLYSGKFTLRQASHVFAVATRDGWLTSDLIDANFYNDYILNQPSISWESSSKTVTIDPRNDDVTVYYTIDNSDPNESTTRKEYKEPFTLNRNLTIRAIAVRKGYFNSPITEFMISDIDNSFLAGDIRYRIIDNTVENVVEVTGKDGGYSGHITIPESVKDEGGTTYQVTRIGNRAFWDCDGIIQVTMPSTITSIGYQAFFDCGSLTNIDFPSSLRTIEKESFHHCPKLESIILPEGLSVMESNAFSECAKLGSVVLPSTLAVVPERAFYLCSSLVSVQIPRGVKELGIESFYKCYALPSVVVPEGITTIPESCFEECSALESVSLPSTLTKLDRWAFNYCYALKTIILPASVNEINYRAFKECNNMTSLYVLSTTPPTIVTESSESPFAWIIEKCTLYVPSESALEAYQNTDYWKDFSNIAVAKELPCEKPTFLLSNYILSMSSQTDGAVIYFTRDNTDPTTDSDRYTRPIDFNRNDTIRAIAVKSGFANSEVSEFRKSDFKVATPDIEFSFEGGWLKASSPSPASNVEEAKLYYTMSTDSYWWPNTYNNEEEVLKNATLFAEPLKLTRPGKIQVVALRNGWLMSGWSSYDFYTDYWQEMPSISWDSSTKTVTITHNDPDVIIYYTLDGTDPNTSDTRKKYTEPFTILRNFNVKAIVEKPERFNSLTNAYDIVGIDSRFQKDGLYYRLVDNTEENVIEVTSPAEGIYEGDISIPGNVTNGGITYRVTRIGKEAFNGQSGVTSVSIPTTVTSIGDRAFYGCSGLTAINIPSSIKSIEAHAFHECTKLTQLTLHDGLETIGDDAFANCNKIESLILPATLTSIGREGFTYCRSLKEVSIPDVLITIGAYAFNYNTSLTSVYIPNSVTEIGEFAFSHNESLTYIHIPEHLTKLPQDMLSYCYQLESVDIPASVQELSQGVFYHDEKLKSISLPEGITIIPLYQFTGCESLIDVSLPSTLTKIDYEVFNGCTALQSIILPAKLESIGSSAFSGCTSMTSVYSLNPVPPAIESSTWEGVTTNATLYVPSDEAVTAYEVASYWSNFKSIEKMAEGLPCAQPSFSFADYKLTMVTQTEGATIYYTNDDSDPTASNTRNVYTEPIDFWMNDTIRAVAVKAGMSPSPIGTFIRNDFKVATPTISISDDLVITIATEEPVPVPTQFYYRYADGNNTPSRSNIFTAEDVRENCILYDTDYRPTKPGRMLVIALREGWIMSDWVSFDYYNEFNLGQPAIKTDQTKRSVILSHSEDEVSIYYTLDGSEPTKESTLYTDTIFLTENCTVKAIAMKFRRFNSDVKEQSISWFRVAKPTITFSAITVTIDCEEPCDTIFYTLDDTSPTRQSTIYTGPFTLDKNCYVKAFGVHKNWTDSEIASEYYNATEHTCQTPTFTDRHNINSQDSTLVITSTEGASIYYTLDGTDPTEESKLYTGPIKIERNDTVRAIAMRDDMIPSAIGQYIIKWVQLHEPLIEFNGIYCTITQDKPGSNIYYTLDNTDPTKSSTRKVFTEQIKLTEQTVIKAYAVLHKYLDSDVASRTFDPTGKTCETPSISRVETTSNFIQMNTTTDGATIYYTTNGLTPTKSDKVYTEPFEVTQNQTIKAIAMRDAYYDSNVSTFEVNWFTVARPVITVDGVFVTITCATPDAKIYYTLNGANPTSEDNLYTGTMTMTSNCTIKAFAVRDNFNDSQITTLEFSMNANTCGTPTFSRIPKTNYVSISSALPEGISTPTTIYYTTDGSTPTRESTVFNKEKIYIEMTENCTLKALAVNEKLFDSAIGEFTVDWFKVDAPHFSYDEEGRMIISCDTANVTIYYDFDKEATTSSNVYTEPIVLTDNRTVYAFGTRKNFHDSDMAHETPGAFVCDDVTYEYNGRYLTMKANEGATIYYTTDGSIPTDQTFAYFEPVEVTSLCTVKAVAKKKDYTDSDVTSFEVTYLFNGEDVDMSEAGHLEDVFEWIGGTEGLTSLPVNGQLNEDDIRFIKNISTLEHLDLSNATVVGKRLASESFAGMNIVSFESPKEVGEIGEHLFKGCKKLAAVVWNASSAIPQEVLDDIENPNLLLYVNSRNLAPNTYTGNLISGGEATSIVLRDTESGGNFYCPKRFFAQSISYTHEYKQQTPDPLAHAAQGWETLALPFDVQTITHETRGVLAPFAKSADVTKLKPFWLYSLSGTGFVRAAEIKAYTPYIISMPNHASYADDYILAGKVTFSSAEVYVDADQANIVTKGSIEFIPSFQRIAPANDIMNINLNDCTDNEGYAHVNGSAFIPGLREVRPFEAYALDHSLQSAALRIGDLMDWNATDIHNAEMKALEQMGEHEGIFDVTGRKISNSEMELRRERILEPGIYIINGKKIVVK